MMRSCGINGLLIGADGFEPRAVFSARTHEGRGSVKHVFVILSAFVK